MLQRYASLVALAVLAPLLWGCQTVGPLSIQQGRPNYNNVIQETAKAQIFANIVRVHNREPTLFVDVTEVDATVTATGTAGLSMANIGAKTGRSGGATAGASYSESPLVRYFPLIGQPLVQQISSPITAESLSYLFDSNWSVPSVMQLTIDRLTPDAADYGAALNAISQLDSYNALVLAAYPSASAISDLRSKGSGAPSVANLPNDTLVMYLAANRPLSHGSQDATRKSILHLWIRLLRIYEGTQPAADASLKTLCGAAPSVDACLDGLDRRVEAMDATSVSGALRQLPNSIELRTRPTPGAMGATDPAAQAISPPTLRTRSALGVLKAGAEYNAGLRFISPDHYAELRAAGWNSMACARGRGFFLDVPREDRPDEDADHRAVFARVRAAGEGDCDLLTMDPAAPLDVNQPQDMLREQLLLNRRAFVVIVKGPAPGDAYVSYSTGGATYYIAGDDEVSKVNFTLLSQLLTMQAVASPSASSTPVIAISH
ncbi:MAG: hypothetical protein ACHP7N_07940 [Caulobacterales bacterium]